MRSTTTANTGDPLGPDSLTWKYFGDLRTGMLGVWIGAIQNMYPDLGAGVEDHSVLLREPLQRVARSVYPIMGVVYDGDRAAQTGDQIKSYHKTIKGIDAEGRRYHALNPETFYWAHATFFMLIIKTAEYFCGGLTEAEKRQLFDEHVQWYRMYRMSMRPVPNTWEEFQAYWDRQCSEELEINKATLDIFTIRIPTPWFVLMPTPIWDQLFRPMVGAQRWIAAGLFDPAVREKAGMRWTPGDEVLLRIVGKLVEMALTPRWWRRPRSCHPPATGVTFPCTTCRRASRCWIGPAPWCTPPSLWRVCGRRAVAVRQPEGMLEWSDVDLAVRDAVREFVDKEIRPHVDALESGEMEPYPIIRKLFATFGIAEMARDSLNKRLARLREGGEPSGRRASGGMFGGDGAGDGCQPRAHRADDHGPRHARAAGTLAAGPGHLRQGRRLGDHRAGLRVGCVRRHEVLCCSRR